MKPKLNGKGGRSWFNQKEVHGSTKRKWVAVPQLCRALVAALSLLLLWPQLSSAAGVWVLFDPSSPASIPFPNDRFTIRDKSQNTQLRVNLPKPDCTVRPSACEDIDVINTLDGFNLQPRLSIPTRERFRFRPLFRELARAGIRRSEVVAASLFTTQSSTAILEKIRDQIKAETPAPVDFLLGPGGSRTVFPVSEVTGITVKRQVGTAPTFQESPFSFLGLLQATPGVGQIAFGKYRSPDYQTAGQFIPPVGTRTGTPAVQGTNEIFFNLVLPAGEKPPGGWPVAIFGHGGSSNKEDHALPMSAAMAPKGIATLGINAVGTGGGPLGTLAVSRASGDPVSFPAGGRGIDQNGDGKIVLPQEGHVAAPPRGIIGRRDGQQQMVVDLMELVRMIEVGMDVDGDGVSDLNPSHIYYLGVSFGGTYGAPFLAVEPAVRAGALIVPGAPSIETTRLSPGSRPVLGTALSSRVPSLINVGGPSGREFNENLPLRNQPPVINDVAGAMEIQEFLDHTEWVRQAGDPVAYAPHLRKAPLDGVPARPVLLQFAKGDQTVPNLTNTAMLRAGELADLATFYRHDLAFSDLSRNPTGKEVPKDPHTFHSYGPGFFPAVADVGAGARRQMAEFFASDGATVIDPDGAEGPLFEVPIAGPLPEELNFIP